MRLATATLTAAALLGGVGALVTTGSAAVVKPDQHFIGTVNGNHVNAVVYLVCPGPAQPGQTRHPAGGQYVATILVATGSGYTGDSARTVIARFEDDPSTAVSLRSYGVAGQVPTTLLLPCSGV